MYYKIRQVLNQFKIKKIPMDGFWLDIDYMEDKKVFTVDNNLFNASRINKIKQIFNKYLVIIIHPVVAVKWYYKSYTRGKNENVFIKDSADKLAGVKLWPGYVNIIIYFYFIKGRVVDFTHPNASNYWKNEL